MLVIRESVVFVVENIVPWLALVEERAETLLTFRVQKPRCSYFDYLCCGIWTNGSFHSDVSSESAEVFLGPIHLPLVFSREKAEASQQKYIYDQLKEKDSHGYWTVLWNRRCTS